DMPTRVQRSDATDLMIRHIGNVRTHGAGWINQRSAVLDPQARDGVAVVAAPNLRHVVQDAWVITSAATGAAFEQDVWKLPNQALHEGVDTELVAMRGLTLALGHAP